MTDHAVTPQSERERAAREWLHENDACGPERAKLLAEYGEKCRREGVRAALLEATAVCADVAQSYPASGVEAQVCECRIRGMAELEGADQS